MARKPSASADPNVPAKPKRDKKPAEVINLPLAGNILGVIRKISKAYRVPIRAIVSRFATEIESILVEVARKIVAELEAERAAAAASMFETATEVPAAQDPNLAGEEDPFVG